MKKAYLFFMLLCAIPFWAQVGINTTNPNAQLDIRSSNQAAPTNADGILIPKVDIFPATNPTTAQQGMLVYLTTATTFSGNPKPIGFYYWNDSPADWIAVKGTDGGTLDQAYDFGGAGLGKTITADAGAVLINGTDGLISTGSLFSGATVPDVGTGFQSRMIWNPRKGAFRAGYSQTGSWNDINIGFISTAFGFTTTASADYSTAFGSNTVASGNASIAMGTGSRAIGSISTAFGDRNEAIGNYSTAFGRDNTAPSAGETVLGIGATFYTPSTNGNIQIRTANANDRLFVIGNAIDANNSGIIDTAERSDAMVVLKNGNTGIGTSTPLDRLHIVGNLRMIDGNQATGRVLTSDVNGTATWQNASANAWGLTGNTGTNATTNFIGTSNDQDLIFRRNNTISGRISLLNTSFGVNSLLAPSATGNQNTAYGNSSMRNTTDGIQNSAFGSDSLDDNTIGFGNTAVGTFSLTQNTTGGRNTGIGRASLISNITGIHNTALGFQSDVLSSSLNNATAIGAYAAVGSNNSLVLGSIAGVNFATSSVNVGIGTTTPLDRLHVVGNLRMVDGNQAAGRILTSDANGTATWTNPIGATNGTLDQAYDFGGSGLGNTITADAGAVLINGTDGLVAIGTVGVGALAPTGSGPKMFWNPRKAAFRAGQASSTTWDDVNVGVNSVAMGSGTVASGLSSIALGSSSIALGMGSVAIGWSTRASATQSTAFGLATNANNIYSTAFGYEAVASGRASISFGVTNEAESFGETVLGIGATSYTPSLNGANQFRAANATDRLLVVGNAIDTDNDDAVDNAERSNALVILKNGNTGIGASLPVEKLQVAGRTLLTNGFSADNAALLYQNNTDYMFLGPQSGSSANGAAMALFGTTNVSGGNAGGVDFNVPTGQVRMNHTNGNFIFGANSTSGYNANFELNDVGLEIGHNAAARAITFNPSSTERMRLTPLGNLGIGTNNPLQKVHVSGPAGLTAVRIANTSGVGANSNVALDFFRNTAVNTDWRIYNIGANLTIGNSADDLATVNDLYQFQGGRFMPMDDAILSLGQAANRWNTLFASNGTINTSDAREKKNVQNLTYGLNELLQLRPVSFEWKKDDGSGTKLGLIAQELQQVVPEVVRDWDWEVDEQGNRKKVASPILGVYYSDLIPVLIKSIQEQQQKIDQQNAELEQLRAQLVSQNNRILERLEKLERTTK